MNVKFNMIKIELLIFPPKSMPLTVFHVCILLVAQDKSSDIILDASLSYTSTVSLSENPVSSTFKNIQNLITPHYLHSYT